FQLGALPPAQSHRLHQGVCQRGVLGVDGRSHEGSTGSTLGPSAQTSFRGQSLVLAFPFCYLDGLDNNGYIRVDFYGGLNQMRRDFCDGVGIARLLNATLVLPRFEAAAYWNESR
ncbi:O-fucosyltransferase 13, partial [Linum perenne]